MTMAEMKIQTKFWQSKQSEVDCIYLQRLNERLVNDTEVVQWYIDVFEDG